MKEIPLSKGAFAIVDDEDYVYLSKFKWYLNSKGYAARGQMENGRKRTLLMHREILRPKGKVIVDHINFDKLDNRRSNIRLADYSLNNANKWRKDSGDYKGVYYHKGKGKYQSAIDYKHKTYYLGQFDNKHDAARMYNFWAIDLFGEFAYLNKIKEDI